MSKTEIVCLKKGICVIGNFESSLPNPLALDAIKKLIKCGVEKEYIKPNYLLRGHRQVRDTECPGNRFQFFNFFEFKLSIFNGFKITFFFKRQCFFQLDKNLASL